MAKCKWNKAWVGPCPNPTIDGSNLCIDHCGEICVSCGSTATHECEETGQFVCGFPLCDDCEHTIFPDGTNGGVGFNEQRVPQGMKRHIKKTDQKFQPWHVPKTENTQP